MALLYSNIASLFSPPSRVGILHMLYNRSVPFAARAVRGSPCYLNEMFVDQPNGKDKGWNYHEGLVGRGLWKVKTFGYENERF